MSPALRQYISSGQKNCLGLKRNNTVLSTDIRVPVASSVGMPLDSEGNSEFRGTFLIVNIIRARQKFAEKLKTGAELLAC